MPLVVANEHGIRQTESGMETYWRCGVVGLPLNLIHLNRSLLERYAIEGDSPLGERWKIQEVFRVAYIGICARI